MKLNHHNIAVIGLGYVGLPLAVEFGKKRLVLGFDIKVDRIAELQAGHDYSLEMSKEQLQEARYLTFTSDKSALRTAIKGDSRSKDVPMIFIVTVPTPVDAANRPDLIPLIKASETVGQVLKAGDVVIFESTVYPGCTEEVCVPVLERESGLEFLTGNNCKNSDGFFAAYSPERINPGDKTRRLPDIKKVTSGSTPEIAQAVDALYQEIVTAGTHLAGSIKVAEASKVIENAQRDLNIAFVNELSLIFNRIGIDTTEVLEAAGTKWNFLPFKPGLVGGHCIGVDPYYLTHKAQELGYHPQVILSGRAINDNMGRYAAQNIIRLMLKNGMNVSGATIGLLGITFKENCPDVRNSKAIDIFHELQNWGATVRVMDPWANSEELEQEYGVTLTKITSQNPVDSLIIAVAHSQFALMTPIDLAKLCSFHSKPVIGDLKALHNAKELEEQGFVVFRF
jgi:UDP-N-acetyl-D-galactosamine dehydrogenase